MTLDRRDNDSEYSPGNCRWASRPVQGSNKGKFKGASSRYVGVHFSKVKNVWVSAFKLNKEVIHVGSFPSEKEAADAYDKKVMELDLCDIRKLNKAS